MRRAILTVIREGDECARELELPTDVETTLLVELLVLYLDSQGELNPAKCILEAHPPGRALAPTETLDDVEALDGSCLVLRSVPSHDGH